MKTPMVFEVTTEEITIINKWLGEVQQRLIESGKKKGNEPFGEGPKQIYYGVNGGALTYSFIPTSLGNILVVKEAFSKEELNVTAANNWKNFG